MVKVAVAEVMLAVAEVAAAVVALVVVVAVETAAARFPQWEPAQNESFCQSVYEA
jgi:hypothetical protein